jgi:hypothetical protein
VKRCIFKVIQSFSGISVLIMSTKPDVKDNTAELAFLDNLATGLEEEKTATQPDKEALKDGSKSRADARNAMLDTSAELAFLDELAGNQVGNEQVPQLGSAGAVISLASPTRPNFFAQYMLAKSCV